MENKPSNPRADFFSRFLLFLIPAVLASCGMKSLSTEGRVRLWIEREDSRLSESATEFKSMSLEIIREKAPMLKALETPDSSPDLIFTEWNRDFLAARSKIGLEDFSDYRFAHSVFGSLLPRLYGGKGVPVDFLPASVYTWGLFYNPDVLAANGIEPPRTMNEFQMTISKLKAGGMTPIALGSTFGWPASGWISYLDLRLNGVTAHRDLISGKRRFDDRSMNTVYETLQVWRDSNVFSTDSGLKNWPDALADVSEGEAAFTLLGSFAITRLQGNIPLEFMAVPSGVKGMDRGEVVSVQGFIVPLTSANPGAAVNLAATYVLKGSPGQVDDVFRLPSVKPKDGKPYEGFKAIEAGILERADGFVPQLDRILPAQAAYDTNRTMVRFFAPGSKMTAAELAEELNRINPVRDEERE